MRLPPPFAAVPSKLLIVLDLKIEAADAKILASRNDSKGPVIATAALEVKRSAHYCSPVQARSVSFLVCSTHRREGATTVRGALMIAMPLPASASRPDRLT